MKSRDTLIPYISARNPRISSTVIPPAYNAMILSSRPSKCVSPFGTISGSKDPTRSRGIATRTSPCSVSNVFGVVPLREFPLPRPPGSPRSYPRCSVSSAPAAVSTNRPINSLSNPPGPVKSSGDSYPASNSSSNSWRISPMTLSLPRQAPPAPGLAPHTQTIGHPRGLSFSANAMASAMVAPPSGPEVPLDT